MNRPTTRAPAPPPANQQTVQEREHEDATYTEVTEERPNNLPAQIERTEEARMAVSEGYSERANDPEDVLPESGPGAVIAAIAAIMTELKPVEKLGWNDFHRYAHVRMQDLSRELTPLMGKHGIVVFQNEEGRELFDKGAALAVRYRFTVVHKSGAIWPQRPLVTGVSAARNRGGFDDKALNKCHTAARKYFLLSLFQIASEDDADAGPQDHDAPRQRPQGAPRRAPGPDGKVKPHTLPIVDQEPPEAWATRFKEFVDKAKSEAEIDDWYNANAGVFDKLKKANEQVYTDTVEFMDACATKFNGAATSADAGKPDPISTGKPNGNGKAVAATPEKTFSELWLEEITNVFAACEDVASLTAEQTKRMLPMKNKVSGSAYNSAVDLVQENLKRIQGG